MMPFSSHPLCQNYIVLSKRPNSFFLFFCLAAKNIIWLASRVFPFPISPVYSGLSIFLTLFLKIHVILLYSFLSPLLCDLCLSSSNLSSLDSSLGYIICLSCFILIEIIEVILIKIMLSENPPPQLTPKYFVRITNN